MADAGTPAASTPPAATPAASTPTAVTPPATPPTATPAASMPPASTPPTASPPAGDSTQLEPSEWMKAYSPESQEIITKNNWKDPNELIKSYSELRAKVAEKGIQQPPADAPQAEWDAFYKALGRPEKAQEYTFALPPDSPPDLPYDAAFADSFRNWAHEAGLNKTQAQALHDKYVKHATEAIKGDIGKLNERITSSHDELVKSWGQPGTEGYGKNVEMARRALRNLDPGLQDALKNANLLTPDGTVLSAPVAKALAKVGMEIYSEDSLYGAGQLVADTNPWTKGKENLKRQGEIYNADPNRARELMRAAGLKPTI